MARRPRDPQPAPAFEFPQAPPVPRAPINAAPPRTSGAVSPYPWFGSLMNIPSNYGAFQIAGAQQEPQAPSPAPNGLANFAQTMHNFYAIAHPRVMPAMPTTAPATPTAAPGQTSQSEQPENPWQRAARKYNQQFYDRAYQSGMDGLTSLLSHYHQMMFGPDFRMQGGIDG